MSHNYRPFIISKNRYSKQKSMPQIGFHQGPLFSNLTQVHTNRTYLSPGQKYRIGMRSATYRHLTHARHLIQNWYAVRRLPVHTVPLARPVIQYWNAVHRLPVPTSRQARNTELVCGPPPTGPYLSPGP
jgi:hypothetical protein